MTETLYKVSKPFSYVSASAMIYGKVITFLRSKISEIKFPPRLDNCFFILWHYFLFNQEDTSKEKYSGGSNE